MTHKILETTNQLNWESDESIDWSGETIPVLKAKADCGMYKIEKSAIDGKIYWLLRLYHKRLLTPSYESSSIEEAKEAAQKHYDEKIIGVTY